MGICPFRSKDVAKCLFWNYLAECPYFETCFFRKSSFNVKLNLMKIELFGKIHMGILLNNFRKCILLHLLSERGKSQFLPIYCVYLLKCLALCWILWLICRNCVESTWLWIFFFFFFYFHDNLRKKNFVGKDTCPKSDQPQKQPEFDFDHSNRQQVQKFISWCG